MSTPFSNFYPVMRAVLGDRRVMGLWHYKEEDLLAALRSVFALGTNPNGYALYPDAVVLSTSTGITPAVALGDSFALITYDACLLMVTPEDGKMAYRTRSLSVRDGGDRKRDIMLELGQRVYEIRNGGSFFRTYQSFAQWAGMAEAEGVCGILNPAYIKLEVKTGVQNLTL